MNGNLEYENKFQKRIDKLLQSNPKLRGYYSFIGDKSISTIFKYLVYINAFLEYTGKNPNELDLDDFSGYMMKIQRNSEGQRTTSSYRIAVYSALKKYGKYLVASNQLDRNPMDYIDRPKAIDSQETIEKREIGYLSKKEIKTYTNAVIKSNVARKQPEWRARDLAIIMIFLNTGIRCSALIKIDVANIDFKEKTLTVTDKESSVNRYDLSDELVEIINAWMVERESLLNGKYEEALFISAKYHRVSETCVRNIVKKYAVKIDGKNITPHKLRATYGTQLYNASKDIYFVQKCMNHGSPKTTELYVRGNKNQTKKASEIMKGITM